MKITVFYSAPDKIAAAKKAGYIGVGRPVKKITRLANLAQPPIQQKAHPVRNHEGFGLIVGYKQGCDACFSLNILYQLTHLLAQIGIEVAQGLIQQQNGRLQYQGPGQTYALLLATGQLVDFALPQAVKFRQLHDFPNFKTGIPALKPLHTHSESDVLGHIHKREQKGLLEYHDRIALFRRQILDRLPVNYDFTLMRMDQTGYGLEDRRFAGSTGPQQCDHFPIVNLEIQISNDRCAAIPDG